MDNLTQKIKEFFLEQYKELDTTDTFLSFEPIGCIINPDDYRDPITKSYNQVLVNEEISEIVDHVPDIGEVFLPSLEQVSKQYQTLIEGARFNAAAISGEDKSDYLATFGDIKNEALKTLEDADRMSLESVGATYFPATTIPNTWYDTESPIWSFQEFNVENIITEVPKTENEKPIKRINLAWQKIADAKLIANLGTENDQVNLSHLKPNLKGIDYNINSIEAIKNLTLTSEIPAIKEEKKWLFPKSSLINPSVLAKFHTSNFLTPIAVPNKTVMASELKNSGTFTNKALLSTPLTYKTLIPDQKIKTSLSLNRDFTNLIINDINLTETKPLNSQNFNMSFNYCVVQIQRSWFNTKMFNYSNLWYSIAAAEGFFSSGVKGPENQGCLRAIPKAFIIINNLKIKASWSANDLQDAKESAGLGFFNLMNSKMIENELSNPSLQIIGWVCEATPKMPITNDPNLT
jgi:hypothetical protein